MPLAGLARIQAYSAARLGESDHVSWARRQGPAAGRCGGPCDPQPAGVGGVSRISRSQLNSGVRRTSRGRDATPRPLIGQNWLISSAEGRLR